MSITRDNYEAFFIDYLDGNLLPNEVKMLMSFLEDNPDLSQELEGLNNVVLIPSSVPYLNKDILKKTTDYQFGITSTSEYLCIAELEGDIKEDELRELEKISSEDISIQQSRHLYRSIKLQPDIDIVYKGKSSLTRTTILNLTHKTITNIGAIAAGFGLILGVFTLLNNFSDIDSVQLAQDEPIVIIEKPQLNNPKNELDTELTSKEEQYEENKVKIVKQDLLLTQEPERSKGESTNQRENIAFSPISPVVLERFEINDKSKEEPLPILLGKEEYFLIAQKTETSADNQRGQSRSIGIFELAQLGVKRLSNATGGNIKLDADKSDDGNIERIKFETNLFALSVPVGKKK